MKDTFIATATAADFGNKVSDGVLDVLNGIWAIINPYVAGAIVIWLLIIGAKKIAGRSRG